MRWQTGVMTTLGAEMDDGFWLSGVGRRGGVEGKRDKLGRSNMWERRHWVSERKYDIMDD